MSSLQSAEAKSVKIKPDTGFKGMHRSGLSEVVEYIQAKT